MRANVVVGIGHGGSYREQVLSDTRRGIEDIGVPTEIFDAALLIEDLFDMLPHRNCCPTCERLQSWTQLCYVVQLSYD